MPPSPVQGRAQGQPLLAPGAEMGCSEVGGRNSCLPMRCALGFAGEVHAISPSGLVICRDPPALCPSLSHGQRSNASTATTPKTPFLWIYRVLTVPKHPLISNPAHKMFFSKEEAGAVLSFELVKLWVGGAGCSPPPAAFCITR